MLESTREGQVLDPSPEPETDRAARERLLVRLIVGQTIAAGILTIMTATGALLIPGSGLLAVLPLGAIAVVVGLISYWLLRRQQSRLGGYFFLLGTSAAITVLVAIRGYQDASGIYYLWPILGAVMILDTRGGVLVTIVSALLYLFLVVAQRHGFQTPPVPYDPQKEALMTVTSRVLMFFLLSYLTWLSSQRLRRTLQQAHQAVRRWQELNETLEQRVADRTYNLERRSVQLQVAAEVARDAAAARELDDLLNRAVNLIRDRFGFYHAGIFLVDDQKEYAVLRAATGEAGRQMLEQGHRLKVGEVGIVGYVTGRGEPRIALDVGTDAVHFENPLLPETRSEMALPLRLGEQIIGALDVQSQEEAAFGEDDIAVLQTLADQLAVAIENARLLHEMQQTVREVEAISGRYTQESWRATVRSRRQPHGYRYQRLGIEPVVEQPLEARQAWQQGRPVITTTQPEAVADRQAVGQAPSTGSGQVFQPASVGQDSQPAITVSTVAVPMKLRGQVVGVLNLRFAGEPISPETVSLVEEVASRLALALENARLLEETQQRAERDRLIADITARVRSSMDPETILQTAVRQLGLALGADQTFVQVGQAFQPANLGVGGQVSDDKHG
jgi:GAF domain-containing protein